MPEEATDLSTLQFELEAQEPGDERQVSLGEHTFTISAVGEGCDRTRHRVECVTCGDVVAGATTLAVSKMEAHVREHKAAQLPPPPLKPSDEYYILSLSATRGDQLCWWGPKNSGYTCRLDDAGRYTRANVERALSYYHNGEDTLAIPCAAVETHAVRVVPGESALLAELTERRFRMTTDRDDHGDDECSSCGEYPHSTNLGLRVSGVAQ